MADKQASDAKTEDDEAARVEAARAAKEKAEADRAAHETFTSLDRLRERLEASLKKSEEDPGHCDYSDAFLRDVRLKVDEIIAWIERTLGGSK